MKENQIVVNPEYKDIERWVRSLPDTFCNSGELIHKGRNEVRVFRLLDGERVAVKRYRRPLWFQRIDYTCLRSSKAQRAYKYGLRLLEYGIPTPKPIAFIDMYKCGLVDCSFFISSYSPDKDCNVLHDTRDELMSQRLASLFVQMHERRFLHGDSNISNFLFHENSDASGDYNVYTIDINRSRFMDRELTRKECLDNIVPLTHQLDVLRMVVGYYAKARNWNVDETVDYVLTQRKKFEARRRAIKRWKSYLSL